MKNSKKQIKKLLNLKVYNKRLIHSEMLILSNILVILNKTTRSKWMRRLNCYVKYIYFAKIKNEKILLRRRCFLTRRTRAVYRLTQLSRLMTRFYAANGYFTGLKKSSW